MWSSDIMRKATAEQEFFLCLATSSANKEPYPLLYKTTTINRYGMASLNTYTVTTPIFLLNFGDLLHHNNKSNFFFFLRDLAACSQVSCTALVKTQLSPKIEEAGVHVPKYTTLTDRWEMSHDGVPVYNREDLILQYYCRTRIQFLTLLFIHKTTQYSHMHCISLTGCSKPHRKVWRLTQKDFKNPQENGTQCERFFMGDFNFLNVKWFEGRLISRMIRCKQAQAKPLLKLTNTLFIEKSVLRPTNMNNILNLCFTNNIDIVRGVKVTPILVSDHSLKWTPKNHSDLNFTKQTINRSKMKSSSKIGRNVSPHQTLKWNLIISCLLCTLYARDMSQSTRPTQKGTRESRP